MNKIHEMNSGQLNVNPDMGQVEEDMETSTHTYNLRPRPTKINQKYNMTVVGQHSTIAKLNLHIMLSQVGIKEGIRRFGGKGNNALLKEINQLHQ